MTRRKATEQEAAGSDSFLDITTNIVGILIILVMVVGERAKTAPVEPEPPKPEVIAAAGEAVRLEDDVHRLAAQMATVQSELANRSAERGQFATLIAAVEKELAERRAALDVESRAQYDLDRELALARDELARLRAQRREAAAAAAPQEIKIENYPTPIGQTVDSKEAHFQLIRGRLALVPYEALVNRLRSTVREQASRLVDQRELVDTLGPIEGFRLRYVIERTDTPAGSLIQVTYVEFIPISGQLGEPLDEALAPGSRFREQLQMLSPQLYTITVWAYPDSFADFRKLKKELYALGYSVAARPLPEGAPIGASPQGTKSSAE